MINQSCKKKLLEILTHILTAERIIPIFLTEGEKTNAIKTLQIYKPRLSALKKDFQKDETLIIEILELNKGNTDDEGKKINEQIRTLKLHIHKLKFIFEYILAFLDSNNFDQFKEYITDPEVKDGQNSIMHRLTDSERIIRSLL